MIWDQEIEEKRYSFGQLHQIFSSLVAFYKQSAHRWRHRPHFTLQKYYFLLLVLVSIRG
jgi:hypothetical protein